MSAQFERAMAALSNGPVRAEQRDGRPIVLFETLYKNPADGWAIASRAYARALHLSAVDVRLKDWRAPHGAPDHAVLVELNGMSLKPPTEWDLHVYSAPLMSLDGMNILLSNLGDHRCAFYSLFERRCIEPALGALLRRLSGVWVSCRMNAEVLRVAGVEHVHLARPPYFDDDPLLQLDAPREASTFYWIGRFEPRKAPENLLRAFMRAFGPGEARLLLKLSPYPWTFAYEILSPEAVILELLAEPEVRAKGWTVLNWGQSIELLRGRWSAQQMRELHARGHVYVSASRGEGLDLPAFAAKLAGRRMVTAPSGGPEDFVGEEDVVLPLTGLVDADERYNWGPGANYADYDVDALAAAMQDVRGRGPKKRWDFDVHEHNWRSVGPALARFLAECAERRKKAT